MNKVFFILWMMPFLTAAQLQVDKLFSDNMVLQRKMPIHIWGKGVPGENLSVTFSGERMKTLIQNDSAWHVYFSKQQKNTAPQSILINSGNETIVLQNILIGDIWICSGQSNMEWPMIKEAHWKEEVSSTDQSLIRFSNPPPAGRYVYGVAYTDSLNKRLNTSDFYGWKSWQVCDSNSSKEMSAVAYYFGKTIVESESVPIGLINLSIGGAPVETFISREALLTNTRFASKATGNWLENKSLPEWVRQRGRENLANNGDGFKDDQGLNHAYKPGFAFEAGIRPLLPLPVKGVIWYQGESNSLEEERVKEYKELLRLLIDDYRSKWKQPRMPFYWVQLSSIDTVSYASTYWPAFRNEQRILLSEIEGGGMAVSSDLGAEHNVHPTNKKGVGQRLARWALHKTYKKNLVPSGPLPVRALYKKGQLVIDFSYAKGLRTSDGKALRGFTLNGKDDVLAEIYKETVIIKVKQKPEVVYYGWKPFTDANLINSEDLPASTFKLQVQ